MAARGFLARFRMPPEAEPARAAASRATDELRRLASGDGPILAGPWHAEIGYEILYWIPFLRWALEVEPRLAGRLVAVSRGGTASWYEGIAADYLDLFELVEPDYLTSALDAVTDESGGLRKQMSATTLDDELVTLVAGRLGTMPTILHPSLLFSIVKTITKRPPPRTADMPLRFAPLQAPVLDLPELPERFVAVRFYARVSLPDSPENVALVDRVLSALSRENEVVVLGNATRYDDHHDFRLPEGPRIHVLPDVPHTANLAVQTAVIAKAEAFVGTYGGLAYLPSLLGIPSVSFYSYPYFRPQHLEVANRVFAKPPYGRFLTVDTRSFDLLELVLGGSQ